jgi:hypothetical protein
MLKKWWKKIFFGRKTALFAKTSGTTSEKYIHQGIHAVSWKRLEMLLLYIHETGKADFVDGKMIFLQGMFWKKHGMFGRLSGIVAHLSLNICKKNRMPSWETNCIEDWEEIDAIVEETLMA